MATGTVSKTVGPLPALQVQLHAASAKINLQHSAIKCYDMAMVTVSQAKKEKQLGMKIGTAQHRLRVIIMFDLVVKCGMDSCFRCGTKIEVAEEFSIDHKKPWLDIDPEKFWDIGNIAFAHRRCNYGDRRGSPRDPMCHRKIGPEGTAWCGNHKQFLLVDRFTKCKSRPNGLEDRCRDCRRKNRSPRKYARVLLGEQRPSKSRVEGSNPSPCATEGEADGKPAHC